MKASNAARIVTKQQLEVLVGKLNEYVKRKPLREAETAPAAGPAPTSAPSPAPAQAAPQVQASPVAGATEETKETDEQGIPTITNIIDQLNTLRSGRSLKDEEVKTQLQRYYDGLDDSEKEAMHAYFKGVAQILSGQVDAGSAEEPSNHGVAMQSTGKSNKKNIKPNIIRKTLAKTPPADAGAAATVVAATSPRENTTPPAPIVPKKR